MKVSYVIKRVDWDRSYWDGKDFGSIDDAALFDSEYEAAWEIDADFPKGTYTVEKIYDK